MSRTLFLYIFKDLFKIFVMASAALAGIMSFGGLLRPLTREGLDAGQVTRMLGYFGPAMTTYSFPVAALFATAVVYGRLAADNELTACKAGGISLLSITVSGPALVLGLVVAITSLLFLCFVVPFSTLQVERVIYSNLARLVQSRIERNHEIEFEQTTIFAQEAHVIPPGPTTPRGQQQVEMIGVEIISVERDPVDVTLLVPKEFYTASRAFVYIDPLPNGQEVNVSVTLQGGVKFPRRYEGATAVGVETTQYGPFEIPSPIKEDVKFMSVWQLKDLYADLSQSRRMKAIIADFVKNGQRRTFLDHLYADLNGPGREKVFDLAGHAHDRPRIDWLPPLVRQVLSELAAHDEGSYTLRLEPRAALFLHANDVSAAVPGANKAAPPATAPDTRPVERPIVFREDRAGHDPLTVRAASLLVHCQPMTEIDKVRVTITLKDCLQMMRSGGEEEAVPRAKYEQSFDFPMSEASKAMAGRTVGYYESHANALASGVDRLRLVHDKMQLINNIIAESNGRASFAVSCLILVMLGSALGMMFRSGNFLTAFAVSFIPALLSITLIVAGQRTAANVPFRLDGSGNPLQLGLIMVWSGNAINLVLAVGFMWKLGRR
jgi:lipopolysaccharide export LptBFGC system permease protein LptF